MPFFVSITACRLSGTKPLLQAMLTYCFWDRGNTFLIPDNEFKMVSAKWQPFSLDLNVLVDCISKLDVY